MAISNRKTQCDALTITYYAEEHITQLIIRIVDKDR